MRNVVQLLTRVVAAHGQRQEGPVAGNSAVDISAGTRICDFLNLDPLLYIKSDSNNDLQEFIHQIKITLKIMHVSGKEALKLAAYN